MQNDKQKAEEIRKKRELAAKGLKERRDGKPIDPMADVGTLAIDTDADVPETPQEKQKEVGDRGLAVGLGLHRS